MSYAMSLASDFNPKFFPFCIIADFPTPPQLPVRNIWAPLLRRLPCVRYS